MWLTFSFKKCFCLNRIFATENKFEKMLEMITFFFTKKFLDVWWCFLFPGQGNLWFWPLYYAFILFGNVVILQLCIYRYVNRVVTSMHAEWHRWAETPEFTMWNSSPQDRSLFYVILYYLRNRSRHVIRYSCDKDEQSIQESLVETKLWHFKFSYLPLLLNHKLGSSPKCLMRKMFTSSMLI